MARKMTGETNARRDAILDQLDDRTDVEKRQVDGGVLTDDIVDDYGENFHIVE